MLQGMAAATALLLLLGACTQTPSGAALYEVHCAGCHGAHGRGDGPVAPVIPAVVPDLTRIASRRGGRFSDDEVFRIIDGQAHPTSVNRDKMPTWGYELFGPEGDDELAHRRATEEVERLVEHLRSMQE